MDIQPRTEFDEFVRRDVEGGAYRTVEHAVSLLHAHATWVADDRAEIHPESADPFADAG